MNPTLFVHVRVSTVGKPIAELEPLRDAIVALCSVITPDYAVRIKRRAITPQQADALLQAYLKRMADTPSTGAFAASVSLRGRAQQLQDREQHHRDPQRRAPRRRRHREEQGE